MNTPATRQHRPPTARGVQFCRLIFAFALAALVTACAATQPAGDSIKSRAQARWDALLASDYDTAYAFYSPGYRTSHSRTDFEIELRSRRVRWVGAEVLEASCEADVCSVETRVDYKISRPVPGVPEWKSSDQLTERWVRIDGQWWFLPDK